MSQVMAKGGATDHLDVEVQSFALCEVALGARLVGAAVDAVTAFLVLAGEMHLTVADGRMWTVPAGSMLVLPPALDPVIAPAASATRTLTATREILRRRGAVLTFDAAEGARGALRVLVGRIGGAAAAALAAGPQSVDLRDNDLARGCFGALLAEVGAPGPGAGALVRALMTTSVTMGLRLSHESVATPPARTIDDRLAPALEAISARPGDRHSVATLAALAGMSRATFARHFGSAVGTTPMEYLQAARLRQAAIALRGTALTIQQIAAHCGFASRTHFSRAFAATYGLGPRDYRQDHIHR